MTNSSASTNTTPDTPPLFLPGEQYDDRSAARLLPMIDVYMEPEGDAPPAIHYSENSNAWRLGPPGEPYYARWARMFALGERAALLTTHSNVGLVRLNLAGPFEDEPGYDPLETTTVGDTLLVAALAGMASMIGWEWVARVLHNETYMDVLDGALRWLTRAGYHTPEQAAALAQLSAEWPVLQRRAAENVLTWTAAGFSGSPEDLHDLQASARAILQSVPEASADDDCPI